MDTFERKGICFLGLGDTASMVIEKLLKYHKDADYLVIGSKSKASSKVENFIYDPPKTELISGNSNSLVSDLSVDLTLPQPIINLLDTDFYFVLISALGGYTGTMFTIKISQYMNSRQKPFTVIASFPFGFEGESRKGKSLLAIETLAHSSDVILFNLDDLSDESLTLRQVFRVADYKFLQTIDNRFNLKLDIPSSKYSALYSESSERTRKLQEMAEKIKCPEGLKDF